MVRKKFVIALIAAALKVAQALLFTLICEGPVLWHGVYITQTQHYLEQRATQSKRAGIT